MVFTFGTWNILATAYIRPEWYPDTPPEVLAPGWRIPALLERALNLNVDILCLQEVERAVFATFREGMAVGGYDGELAMKEGRPDGCATFYRREMFSLVESRRLAYADGVDGGPASGHIAQESLLAAGEKRLSVLNTHLKWDPPGATADRQWGYRQVLQAIAALNADDVARPQVLCGDLNVSPETDVTRTLVNAGFDYAHRLLPGIYTCNSSRQAKLIDHIFFRGPLEADPIRPPVIDSQTPLPSLAEPSDHLPLLSRFDW